MDQDKTNPFSHGSEIKSDHNEFDQEGLNNSTLEFTSTEYQSPNDYQVHSADPSQMVVSPNPMVSNYEQNQQLLYSMNEINDSHGPDGNGMNGVSQFSQKPNIQITNGVQPPKHVDSQSPESQSFPPYEFTYQADNLKSSMDQTNLPNTSMGGNLPNSSLPSSTLPNSFNSNIYVGAPRTIENSMEFTNQTLNYASSLNNQFQNSGHFPANFSTFQTFQPNLSQLSPNFHQNNMNTTNSLLDTPVLDRNTGFFMQNGVIYGNPNISPPSYDQTTGLPTGPRTDAHNSLQDNFTNGLSNGPSNGFSSAIQNELQNDMLAGLSNANLSVPPTGGISALNQPLNGAIGCFGNMEQTSLPNIQSFQSSQENPFMTPIAENNFGITPKKEADAEI